MRTLHLLGVVLVFVASVARSADAKVKEPPPDVREPRRARPPSRPEITDITSVDYASLPLAAATPVNRWAEAAIRVDEWHSPGPDMDAFAGMRSKPNKPTPSWTVSTLPNASYARVGDYLLPPPGRQFYEYGTWPDGLSGRLAEWFVVDQGILSGRAIEVRRYTGTFENHLAMASTQETAPATALIPGEVYAFRRCARGCDKSLGDVERVEELSVVASHPLWASASDQPALERSVVHEDRLFSVVTAEVRPGTSATVVIDVTSARRLGQYGRPAPTVAVKTYEVDVVWPKDGTLETTLFAGSLMSTRSGVSGWYDDD